MIAQSTTSASSSGQPLSCLAERFDANCAALSRRDFDLAARLRAHVPSREYFIAVHKGALALLRQERSGLTVVPDKAPPVAARQACGSMFPDGKCDRPVVVVGAGYGWLWSSLLSLQPRASDYRPPLYFLVRSIEELWVILHVHEWTSPLADARTRIIVGDDAVEQLRRALLENSRLAVPQFSLNIDPSLWPAGISHQVLVEAVAAKRADHREHLRRLLEPASGAMASDSIRERLQSGDRLKVLGFASVRSSFQRHSMRDWLAAFDEMGHETRLAIEEGDHEVLDDLSCLQACAEFRPDILLLVNHSRAEAAWLPSSPVAVMWVQDQMPQVLDSAAGAKQGPRDFVVGYGRSECVGEFGYPGSRFLAARIGVNERRFSPRTSLPSEIERFVCDVSYVGHASASAEQLVQQCLHEARDGAMKRVISDSFDRLRSIYDAGGSITEPMFLRQIVYSSDSAASLPEAALDQVTTRLMQTANNALFRHQALEWLIDSGHRVHLYGKGWESHPRLAGLARGVADNEAHLCAIYQTSRINLQITPNGAVHQRLCDGLAAGGFFLIRYCGSDAAGPHYRALGDWCRENEIEEDAALAERAPEEIRAMLDRLAWLVPDAGTTMVETLERLSADAFARFSNSIWPAGADMVGNVYLPLLQWCRSLGITSDDEVNDRASPEIRRLLNQIGYFFKGQDCRRGRYIVDFLRKHAEEGYDRFAASVWPEYDQVSFKSRDQLLRKVGHYLSHADERAEISRAMRQVVLERFTYRATTTRLLGMIRRELAGSAMLAAA